MDPEGDGSTGTGSGDAERPSGPVRRLRVDAFGLVPCAAGGRTTIEECLSCVFLVGATRNEQGDLVDLACRHGRGPSPRPR